MSFLTGLNTLSLRYAQMGGVRWALPIPGCCPVASMIAGWYRDTSMISVLHTDGLGSSPPLHQTCQLIQDKMQR